MGNDGHFVRMDREREGINDGFVGAGISSCFVHGP